MKVLIAIPVHNEERYLASILEQVRRYAQGCSILAIDDGSKDKSPEILRQCPGIIVLTHEHNQGYGKTLADAFEYADQEGYDWVITLDADEQHDPARIPDFVRMAAADDCDILSGSRYMKEESSYEQVPGDRRQVNYLITVLLNNALQTLPDRFVLRVQGVPGGGPSQAPPDGRGLCLSDAVLGAGGPRGLADQGDSDQADLPRPDAAVRRRPR